MDGPSNFRPIQPAPPSGAPASGAAAGESDGEDKRPKAPPQPGRRASGLAACDSCRKRKIKCSAERPRCRQCTRAGTPCVFDTRELETPREARSRRHGELEYLYESLRTRPKSDVAAIVSRIRSGADLEDVVRFARVGDILMQLSSRSDPAERQQVERQQVAHLER